MDEHETPSSPEKEPSNRDVLLALEKTNKLLAEHLKLGPDNSGASQGGPVSSNDILLTTRETRKRLSVQCNVPTNVKLRVEFLKIGDVDTKKNEFTADILLEARWQDPALAGKSDEELDVLESRYSEIWDPKLVILNMDKSPSNEDIQYDIEPSPDGIPLVIYRRKLKGSFFERLELRHFPFDVQELSLHVVSEHPPRHVNLELSPDNPSSVHTHSFRDVDEWTLYSTVTESVEKHSAELSSKVEDTAGHFPADSTMGSQSMLEMGRAGKKRKNKVAASCFVARNYWFWIFNVFTVLLLINALTFVPYAYKPTQTTSRLGVMMSLLLTCVAKKIAIGYMLPPISYLTFLDTYVLSVMGFLGLQACQFAVASIWVKRGDTDLIEKIDHYTLIVMICIMAGFNVLFVIFVFFTAFAKRRRLGALDAKGRKRVGDSSGTHKKTDGDKGEREKLNPNESIA